MGRRRSSRNLLYKDKNRMPRFLKVILIFIGIIVVFIAGIFAAYPIMRLYEYITSLF